MESCQHELQNDQYYVLVCKNSHKNLSINSKIKTKHFGFEVFETL